LLAHNDMKMRYLTLLPAMTLLLLCRPALSVVPSQVHMDISAEALARVTLYYKGVPVDNQDIDFPLVVNGSSLKLEKISSLFYLVGNVSQADVYFSDPAFTLINDQDSSFKMGLQGGFIIDGVEKDARDVLHAPVLNTISEGTSNNGFKVHFASELTAGHYKTGAFYNTFTLIVTPVV